MATPNSCSTVLTQRKAPRSPAEKTLGQLFVHALPGNTFVIDKMEHAKKFASEAMKSAEAGIAAGNSKPGEEGVAMEATFVTSSSGLAIRDAESIRLFNNQNVDHEIVSEDIEARPNRSRSFERPPTPDSPTLPIEIPKRAILPRESLDSTQQLSSTGSSTLEDIDRTSHETANSRNNDQLEVFDTPRENAKVHEGVDFETNPHQMLEFSTNSTVFDDESIRHLRFREADQEIAHFGIDARPNRLDEFRRILSPIDMDMDSIDMELCEEIGGVLRSAVDRVVAYVELGHTLNPSSNSFAPITPIPPILSTPRRPLELATPNQQEFTNQTSVSTANQSYPSFGTSRNNDQLEVFDSPRENAKVHERVDFETNPHQMLEFSTNSTVFDDESIRHLRFRGADQEIAHFGIEARPNRLDEFRRISSPIDMDMDSIDMELNEEIGGVLRSAVDRVVAYVELGHTLNPSSNSFAPITPIPPILSTPRRPLELATPNQQEFTNQASDTSMEDNSSMTLSIEDVVDQRTSGGVCTNVVELSPTLNLSSNTTAVTPSTHTVRSTRNQHLPVQFQLGTSSGYDPNSSGICLRVSTTSTPSAPSHAAASPDCSYIPFMCNTPAGYIVVQVPENTELLDVIDDGMQQAIDSFVNESMAGLRDVLSNVITRVVNDRLCGRSVSVTMNLEQEDSSNTTLSNSYTLHIDNIDSTSSQATTSSNDIGRQGETAPIPIHSFTGTDDEDMEKEVAGIVDTPVVVEGDFGVNTEVVVAETLPVDTIEATKSPTESTDETDESDDMEMLDSNNTIGTGITVTTSDVANNTAAVEEESVAAILAEIVAATVETSSANDNDPELSVKDVVGLDEVDKVVDDSTPSAAQVGINATSTMDHNEPVEVAPAPLFEEEWTEELLDQIQELRKMASSMTFRKDPNHVPRTREQLAKSYPRLALPGFTIDNFWRPTEVVGSASSHGPEMANNSATRASDPQVHATADASESTSESSDGSPDVKKRRIHLQLTAKDLEEINDVPPHLAKLHAEGHDDEFWTKYWGEAAEFWENEYPARDEDEEVVIRMDEDEPSRRKVRREVWTDDEEEEPEKDEYERRNKAHDEKCRERILRGASLLEEAEPHDVLDNKVQHQTQQSRLLFKRSFETVADSSDGHNDVPTKKCRMRENQVEGIDTLEEIDVDVDPPQIVQQLPHIDDEVPVEPEIDDFDVEQRDLERERLDNMVHDLERDEEAMEEELQAAFEEEVTREVERWEELGRMAPLHPNPLPAPPVPAVFHPAPHRRRLPFHRRNENERFGPGPVDIRCAQLTIHSVADGVQALERLEEVLNERDYGSAWHGMIIRLRRLQTNFRTFQTKPINPTSFRNACNRIRRLRADAGMTTY